MINFSKLCKVDKKIEKKNNFSNVRNIFIKIGGKRVNQIGLFQS